MRVAVLGDIHSNLEALTAVLHIIAQEDIREIVCTGDVVGYGADPVECIRLIRENAAAVVGGNHDFGAVGRHALDYFNKYAREAIEWTSEQLCDRDRWWLSNLPLVYTSERYQVVHASFYEPESFPYIFSPAEAGPSFAEQKSLLAFFGHTHWPATFFDGPLPSHSVQREVPVDSDEKILVNVGSVGQPRDSDPMASFAVYDIGRGVVTFRRVPYDIDTAARKILDAGLPPILAGRLFKGH